jgi:hypothetical protein
MTIWTHEICYCKYESGFYVDSVHSERRLALRALLAVKRDAVQDRLEFRRLYGKRRGDLYEVQPNFDAQAVRGMVIDGAKLDPETALVVSVQHRDW